MLRISIDKYTLIGISIIAFIIFAIATYMFIAYIIHDGRKFKSINIYNESTKDKIKTYNENIKDYNVNVEKSGVNYKKKTKLKILKFIFDFFKRGSK